MHQSLVSIEHTSLSEALVADVAGVHFPFMSLHVQAVARVAEIASAAQGAAVGHQSTVLTRHVRLELMLVMENCRAVITVQQDKVLTIRGVKLILRET